MNVKYIWLASLNAMQIKISFAVAVISISRYAQHAACPGPSPPRRFRPLPRPVDFWPNPAVSCPVKKKPSPSIPGLIALTQPIARINY